MTIIIPFSAVSWTFDKHARGAVPKCCRLGLIVESRDDLELLIVGLLFSELH